MADAVAALLSFPPDNAATLSPKDYDKAVHAYIAKLDKLPGASWTKPVGKQNVLDLLNPAVNSIPYAVCIIQQLKEAGKDQKKLSELLDYAILYCTSFDPIQMRYQGGMWRDVVEQTMNMLANARVPDFSPVTTAMLRLDPTSGTFTSLHCLLLRRCYETGVPSQALPILDKNIYAFPTAPPKGIPEDVLNEPYELSNAYINTKSGFTQRLQTEWILEYYLLGASVYITSQPRNYARARLFLEYILLHPSQNHATSALQTEAYKKWILVALLSEGTRWSLPRTHDQAVMKSIRSLAKAYDAIAEDFEKRDVRKLAAEMEAGYKIWVDDGNSRLVQELGQAVMRWRVVDLQKMYAALPVSRVATYLGYSAGATAAMLADFVRSGHLSASISQAANPDDAVLRFHLTSTETSSEDDLEAQTARIQALTTFVRDADRRLRLTNEYITTEKRAKRSGPEGDIADQMDLTWDQPAPGFMGDDGDGSVEGDEDIMAS